ncbi:zf-BED domain-containing protein/DUF659 domain-containing protein/Dimer_Tnp_hAT domain-containing protein [Senna tora]|uniref:Zf-BED domain-containing protein/DUF659 domain-containing protein/Dimer_Tnp_hAT domain-containing protein n=1 Tax=Senna tora TaxID=362788 RepID=A0A834SDX6_9FABA|nr:zf-BED domain-containing protein/DUF659 domain-containing protein/Dimer_Tnp_hAT domain-containing protein [Senna tora]
MTEKVFEMLDEIVEQAGEENVVQVITDNAANYKAAGQLLMQKRKRLCWIPCAAHCIDLRTMLITMLKHFTKAYPLIKVLRLVNVDDNPAMGFIYEEMDKVPNLKLTLELNIEYECMDKMLTMDEKHKVEFQLEMFKEAKGLFGIESVVYMRCRKEPAQWWDSYGDHCPELQKFTIRTLSLTCSSSGCECNWSAFEMVHTKRRNRLHQKKMNDLVFVMYNQKLKDKKVRELADLDNIPSDDEWIIEDVVTREDEEGEDVAFEVQNLDETRPHAIVDLEILVDLDELDDVHSDDSDDDEDAAMEE